MPRQASMADLVAQAEANGYKRGVHKKSEITFVIAKSMSKRREIKIRLLNTTLCKRYRSALYCGILILLLIQLSS
jgi:hypothetical protein